MRLLKKIISKLRIKEVHIEKVMAVPPQAGMLHGKRVLLIGGSQGIGKAIAERFIQSEAKVVIVSRREIGLDDALASAEYIKGDISLIDKQNTILEEAIKILGGIDILINCAGIQSKSELQGKGFLDISVDDWDMVMSVNLKGIYFMCQVYAKYLISKKEHGNIINICSVTGLKPRATPYGISKWGITDVTKALGTYLAPFGIRVNGVAPGMVNTAMLNRLFKDDPDNYYRSDHPDGRCACTDDIANVVLFLASDYSKHIAGEVIVCDGAEINS